LIAVAAECEEDSDETDEYAAGEKHEAPVPHGRNIA
jgi:hypothetical protein